MDATLIYNPQAGAIGGRPAVEVLTEELQHLGYRPEHRPTACAADLDQALQHPGDLVVVAGGDGTGREILTRLRGTGVPVLLLPFGTANNIAKSLGLGGDPLALLRRLPQAEPRPFDLGRITGPWGTDYFVEGCGFGFFADTLASYHPEAGKSLVRVAEALTRTLSRDQAYSSRLTIDHTIHDGEFLLVEFLNTTAVGPRLHFAPEADPTDGTLNLVYIEAAAREHWLTYAASLLREEFDLLETVNSQPCHEATFAWHGFPCHVDGEVRPLDSDPAFGATLEEPRLVTVAVLPGAATLLIPPALEQKEAA